MPAGVSPEEMLARQQPFVEEYRALRAEIAGYHSERNSYINYLIVSCAAIVGLAAQRPSAYQAFLLFPVLGLVFSILYADKTVRIIRLADYLHNEVRPALSDIVGMQCLGWEIYKREKHRYPKILFSSLDRARWLLFVIAEIGGVTAHLIASDDYRLASLDRIGTGFGILAVILTIAIALAVEETGGANHTPKQRIIT